MRLAYLDCPAGISGNMMLGALLDLGLPLEWLTQELQRLPLTLPRLEVTSVTRQGLTGLYFEVAATRSQTHRNLATITDLIERAGFNSRVTETALRCFNLLAEAEAKIHGVALDQVHFHELGAVDAIIDIVGTSLGIDWLQVERIMVSPIRVGFGTVQCQHGEIPLPAPAALELLTGFPVFRGELEGEWATPTGACLVRGLMASPGPLPILQLDRIGYGAGRQERAVPNLLRIWLGEAAGPPEQQDRQLVLETNIDDMNPELYSDLGARLLAAGAKDYYFTPIQMKKERPGVLITVLAPPEVAAAVEALLLTETTTLGVRCYPVERHCLERAEVQIDLAGAVIRIKTAFYHGRLLKFAPEYEDCRRAAEQLHRPVKEIYDQARFQAQALLAPE